MQRLTYAAMKALVLKKLGGELPNTHFLDVRDPEGLADGSIPTAVHVPLRQLREAVKLSAQDFKQQYHFQKPEKSEHIVTYCLGTFGAEKAASMLTSAGYTNVDVYPGSWKEWKKEEQGGN